jgi:hypothetical protein
MALNIDLVEMAGIEPASIVSVVGSIESNGKKVGKSG